MNVLKRLKNLEERIARLRIIAGDGIAASESIAGTIISSEAAGDVISNGMFAVFIESVTENGKEKARIVCRNTDLEEPEDFSDDTAGDVLVNNHHFTMKAWRHSVKEGIVALHFTSPDEVELLVSQSQAEEVDNFGECEIVLYDDEDTLPQPTDKEFYYPIARVVEEEDEVFTVTQCHRPLGMINVTWQGPCYDLLRDQLENGYYAEE